MFDNADDDGFDDGGGGDFGDDDRDDIDDDNYRLMIDIFICIVCGYDNHNLRRCKLNFK